jgi:hypothetical protein
MRNGRTRLFGVMALAWTTATFGCSSSSSDGGAGGSVSSSGSGGAASLGGGSGHAGTGGGSSGNGGVTSLGGSSASGGSSGGSAVTTLSGIRPVNALTTAEATQLCNDTYAYFGSASSTATTCKWRGLSYAASSSAPSQAVLQQNCSSQESGCVQAAKPWDNNSGCSDIPATCTATVTEYSTCISDEVAAFVQVVNGLPSCTTLASTDTAAIFEAQAGTPPASCVSFSDKCPDLTPPGPLIQ